MSKAVIFDWGGVLMRTVNYSPRHAWDERLGLPPGSVERVVHGITAWQAAQKGEIDLETYWQAVAAELNLSSEQLAGLRRDFYSGDRLDGNLVGLIRDLKARGIPVGLMSNNTLDLIDTLSELGLSDCFDACVISAEIGVMKPDPGAYRAILDRVNVAPHNAIFIDDFPRNVEGARAVGMAAIHFTPGVDVRVVLEKWLNEQDDVFT
jgi:epoxide hydrolase-like predicted phosphatase